MSALFRIVSREAIRAPWRDSGVSMAVRSSSLCQRGGKRSCRGNGSGLVDWLDYAANERQGRAQRTYPHLRDGSGDLIAMARLNRRLNVT